jgi:hypothetical protein
MGSDNVIAQTDALARERGISPAGIARREAFLEFTEEDASALAAVHDALESCRPQIIDALYFHLASFDELQPLLGDGLDRLREAQSSDVLFHAMGKMTRIRSGTAGNAVSTNSTNWAPQRAQTP